MKPACENPPDQEHPAQPGWVQFLLGFPLALLGAFVTVLFLIILIIHIVQRMSGGAPGPGFLAGAGTWLIFGASPLGLGLYLRRARQASKRFWLGVGVLTLIMSLLASTDGYWGPNDWYSLSQREVFPRIDADKLERTLVTPHLHCPIKKGKNVLWCGTFQLAWNAFLSQAGAGPHFDRTNETVTALNLGEFTTNHVDDASYVALAGSTQSGIHSAIRKAVQDKFGLSFQGPLLSDKTATLPPTVFVAYACLLKNLRFETPFSAINDILRLEDVSVPAFGFDRRSTVVQKLQSQVNILDYSDPDDFVLELKTTSVGDRLILAKVRPSPQLISTVTNVLQRVALGRAEPNHPNDVLVVPRIKLDLTRRYTEVEGLKVLSTSVRTSPELVLLTALQSIAFELNERGAELRSQSHIGFGCAGPPPREHTMVFDKPFLLLLQRKDASVPYFVLWVDNPEVLVTRR